MLHPARSISIGATVLLGLGIFSAGCGSSGGEITLQGAPLISPTSATLATGRSVTFYPGILEIDQHKVSEGFRIQEADGGTLTAAPNPDNLQPAPVLYTAPDHTGTYHVQYVWDAGTDGEKAATATVTVQN